jgi:chitodextrinase
VGVAGYRIYRDGALVATTVAGNHSDSGLTPATNYTYSVVAYDEAGNSSAAATAGVTTPVLDLSPPSTPSSLTASAAKNRLVSLAWGASTDDVGVAGYRVYRNGVLIGTAAGTSFVDTLPRKTTSAGYTVRAYDAAGHESPPSNAVTVKLR